MFGKKQQTINTLRERLASVGDRQDVYWNNWQGTLDALARKESELSILQEAFRNGVGITEELKARTLELESEKNEDVAYYEARIDVLDYALNESKGMNRALDEENRDLVRQLELLESVLRQLSITVKFPARK